MSYDNVRHQIENATGAAPWAVKSGNNTLITSSVASDYLKYTYGAFICNDMYNKFVMYNNTFAPDFEKALTAWNMTYNPINNYDKTEITTDITNHGDEVKAHTTGDENGQHNKTTSIATDGAKTATYTTTFDNTTPRLESEDRTTGGTEVTNDVFTTDTTTHNTTTMTIDNTTYTGDEIYRHENTTTGNIGVTTTQQMIMSEAEMRLNPLVKQYLDRFIYMYAYYVGGAWI